MESVNQNAGEHRVKDPVCGMTVDPQSAAGFYEYKGQTYFFCSVGCRERFKADPERFLNHEPASPIGIQRGPKPQPVTTEIVSDPVASTTPSGLPAWGPRSARGSDTQDPTKVGTLNTRARSTDFSRWSHHRQKGPTKVGTLTPGVRVPTSVGSLTT